MTDKNQERAGFRGSENEDLDRVLDAALARYAAAEPRAGLEERILANTRAEHARPADRVWWRWPLAAAALALFAVVVGLAWRWGRPPQSLAKHKPTAVEAAQGTGTQVAKHGTNPALPIPVRRTTQRRPQPAPALAANPKLDQFPSPQPLSEEEKILASYVDQYPERAALLAEARTEVLRRDAEERRQLAGQDQISQQ
jgi:hypothetical protein